MSDYQSISAGEHRRQISAYAAQRAEHYEPYAHVLGRVLEAACRTAIPQAVVQSRAKSITSFAEKCARRYTACPDAVNQFTDLCGARVIVQTRDQVAAVCAFIRTSFCVIEEDDKGLRLAEDSFGYRDMHFVIQLEPTRCHVLGITAKEQESIGSRRAEIQVRTWVQHAWADTLHDRMYKVKLKLPTEFRRIGALLAALMEDGDRTFSRLALDIDQMLANYSAYAVPDVVQREIVIMELLLENAQSQQKPSAALQLARLLIPGGECARAVEMLDPYAVGQGALHGEIMLELGYALCRDHRACPSSSGYLRGQACLLEAINRFGSDMLCSVPDACRNKGLHARAAARLGWSYQCLPSRAQEALACYQKALELEPTNPYYLADVIGCEAHCSGGRGFVSNMTAHIRNAIDVCRAHAESGAQLPYACFTAGRLHLMLDEPFLAMGCYARGIRHVRDRTACMPPDVLQAEQSWLALVGTARPPLRGHAWMSELLQLACSVQEAKGVAARGAARMAEPVLIMGCCPPSVEPACTAVLKKMVTEALGCFAGTVLAQQWPEWLEAVTGASSTQEASRFNVIDYPPADCYAEQPSGDDASSPGRTLKMWRDTIAAGIKPDEVRLLAIDGCLTATAECHVALALGASVGILDVTRGKVNPLLKDSVWHGVQYLYALPPDSKTLCAFLDTSLCEIDQEAITSMAKAIHSEYVRNRKDSLPENMRAWEELKGTYRAANIDQARCAIGILRRCGFGVRRAVQPRPQIPPQIFNDLDVNRVAEMEHGRWNMDRLRAGWRYGPRDKAKKLHNCLVPWSDLPESPDTGRQADRDAVRKWPEILAMAGYEVYRLQGDAAI